MTWAETRRLAYALGVLLFLLVLVSPFVYSYLTTPATCADGIQNQGENAVDAGGPCAVRTVDTIAPVTVRFAKAFKVDEGVYSAVGYIENPNRDVGITSADYEFTLYDEKGIFVATRRGQTRIPPQAVVPVFEAKIATGAQVPVRAMLSFTPRSQWTKMTSRFSDVVVGQARREDVPSTVCAVNDFECIPTFYPRIRATVRNAGLETLLDMPVVVTVFDTGGTALAASKTRIASLAPRQEVDVVYTWNEPFTSDIGRVDIIPIPPPTK